MERALPLARLAAKARPRSSTALRTEALACFRAGLHEEAQDTLDAMFALPDSGRSLSARLILALLKARGGDRDGARQAFEEGASIHRRMTAQPNDAEAMKALLAEVEEAIR